MPNSFIAKITPRGGPAPEIELDELVGIAEERDPQRSWFATRQPGRRLVIENESRVLILGPVATGQQVHAVFAKIVDRREQTPQDPCAQELYEQPDGFAGWWQLEDPRRITLETLAAVPGCHVDSRNSAAVVFNSQLSFTYWEFPDNADGIFDEWVGMEDAPERQAPRRPGHPVAPPESTSMLEPPHGGTSLHGVDFSGGRETFAGNPKLWIAEWCIDTGHLTLRQGTDRPHLCRCDLPDFMTDRGGWWSLDFPFGVATATANALEIHDHGAWLKLCADYCLKENGATALRDAAKLAVRKHGLPWSLRRQVDNSNGTTWFPLFEQLYRQTVYGAGQVLYPLKNNNNVGILPWDDPVDFDTVVVEGFPGVTLRERFKSASTGYKGSGPSHRGARLRILDRLAAEPFSLPITEVIRQRAINDGEGDAVDALILIVAAWVSKAFRADAWAAEGKALGARNATIEGWFPY